jgi:hypothetical protein
VVPHIVQLSATHCSAKHNSTHVCASGLQPCRMFSYAFRFRLPIFCTSLEVPHAVVHCTPYSMAWCGNRHVWQSAFQPAAAQRMPTLSSMVPVMVISGGCTQCCTAHNAVLLRCCGRLAVCCVFFKS